MLNDIETYCKTWGIQINVNKTKILIFEKGGRHTNYNFYLYNEKLEVQCRTQGGAKGAHAPPEATASHTLPPEIFLKNVKRHAKNWYKCESNTCAFTECKNGRTLVKYGNLRLLIRDQTTPHCDARNSKCQIEP